MSSDLYVQIGSFILLMGCGYIFGRWNESRHYRSIVFREDDLRDLKAVAARHVPADLDVMQSRLVQGSTVISVDYFKTFLATVRGIFGGTMHSYETLLERARRESILRMKEQAKLLGSDMIYNVRLETSPVFQSGQKNTTRSIEVLPTARGLRSPRNAHQFPSNLVPFKKSPKLTLPLPGWAAVGWSGCGAQAVRKMMSNVAGMRPSSVPNFST